MISYTLKCDNDHTFDSWFASADAYEKLAKSGMVACSICGSSDVKKGMMAPRVSTNPLRETPLSAPKSPEAEAIEKMRTHVEQNSDYVGNQFASVARAMHLGDTPERSIYGEARPEEAKALIDDGIPVVPLPFMPSKNKN